MTGKNKKKKGRAGKVVLIIILVLLALLAAAILYLHSLAGKSTYLRDDQVQIAEKVVESESELNLVSNAVDYDLASVKTVSDEDAKDTYTLLVIGGDRKADDKGSMSGDAQAIILMTINHKIGAVVLTAIHKDTYAQIPDLGGYRLTDAYLAGGGPLLIRTLEENYGIRINNYASVSLRDVARAIDMPEVESLDISNDGLEVVERMVFQTDIRNPANATRYVTGILPYVTHNLKANELLHLISQIPKVVKYFSVKKMLPFKGLETELDGFKVPKIAETSSLLQSFMYASSQEELAEAEKAEAEYAEQTE